jgi:hypothetical protein
MAIMLQHTCRLIHRVRQQAGSYELCVSPASRRLRTLRSPMVAGVSRINCRSALARECDGAAAHLSSDPPRSPASRLLRTLRFAGKPALADFAFRRQAGACRLCVRRSLPVLPGSIVGARLPAKGVLLRPTCRLVHRVRQQAGSYELCISQQAGACRLCVRRRLPVLPGST